MKFSKTKLYMYYWKHRVLAMKLGHSSPIGHVFVKVQFTKYLFDF